MSAAFAASSELTGSTFLTRIPGDFKRLRDTLSIELYLNG